MLKTVSPNSKFVEYIPLRDYYHRHTRALFWEIQVRNSFVFPFRPSINSIADVFLL